jgi:hypothetical protein
VYPISYFYPEQIAKLCYIKPGPFKVSDGAVIDLNQGVSITFRYHDTSAYCLAACDTLLCGLSLANFSWYEQPFWTDTSFLLYRDVRIIVKSNETKQEIAFFPTAYALGGFSLRKFSAEIVCLLQDHAILPRPRLYYPRTSPLRSGTAASLKSLVGSPFSTLPVNAFNLILSFAKESFWALRMLCRDFPVPDEPFLTASFEYAKHLSFYCAVPRSRLAEFTCAALLSIERRCPRELVPAQLDMLAFVVLTCASLHSDSILTTICGLFDPSNCPSHLHDQIMESPNFLSMLERLNAFLRMFL